ncbi:unnamed protein product [Rotaria socialis]|uniref:Mediator of RNA polymerase II transcription subunit 7 n=2 Tax=Rotaria socialis TaxID=392032 RepID=A0A820D505_9BILA|nr:unnamed protein product [Rotaria socialis]
MFQTLFLNKLESNKWTINRIDKKRILHERWWRQFAHVWQHFLFTVPLLRFLQKENPTIFYAGAYTMFSTHEIACISGLAAAHELGALYPFEKDALTVKQFDLSMNCVHGNCRNDTLFMDPPPLLSSAFPLPPMGYIELFSDDSIRQNSKILQPPPPIEGPYELFGLYVNGIDHTEPIIRSLATQQIQRVYMRPDDYKGELKKLCFAILTNYLDLLQIVSRSTTTQSPDSGNILLREQKLHEIELLFINIHHLINELRPHQARETLRVILEEQKQQREKTSLKLYSFLNRIVDVLNSAVYSLNDHVPKVAN